ncbi:MAG: hypothetical protein P4L76_17755 [Beijerinckiaceae bacterium]|nr:hypothetical protein [Beijerinckiaceae bacterium]
MAFDPEQHEIHPSGFMVDKEDGRPLGIVQAPIAKHPDDGADYPKWVKAHESHLVRKQVGEASHVAAPAFAQLHVDREGVVTVLVDSAEEEAMAMEPKAEETAAAAPIPAAAPPANDDDHEPPHAA